MLMYGICVEEGSFLEFFGDVLGCLGTGSVFDKVDLHRDQLTETSQLRSLTQELIILRHTNWTSVFSIRYSNMCRRG